VLVTGVLHALPVEGHSASGDAKASGGGRVTVDSEEEAGDKALQLKTADGQAEVVSGKRRVGRDRLCRKGVGLRVEVRHLSMTCAASNMSFFGTQPMLTQLKEGKDRVGIKPSE
jgi:hypothetical protein